MRVLLTGATGFVGRHVLDRFIQGGIEVHAVGRTANTGASTAHWHEIDLLHDVDRRRMLANVRPTHLIHLAWTTAHGTYWHCPSNHDWVIASLSLLDEFAAHGGQHAFFAGTCAEDDWASTPSNQPYHRIAATQYGRSKSALRMLALDRANELGVPLAWGRIYFPFGPWEQTQRLIPSLCRDLLTDQLAQTGPGHLMRDFIYVEDLADMIMHLTLRQHDGILDLCSGYGTSIGDIANQLATLIQKTHLLSIGSRPAREGDPLELIGHIDALNALGWQPKFGVDKGLQRTLSWWRRHLQPNTFA